MAASTQLYEQGKYNKLCMIVVAKGLLISGRKGEEVWEELMLSDINQVQECLHDDCLSVFREDKWCFYFAGEKDYSSDLFLEKAKEVFHKCGYCFDIKRDLTMVNQFFVVLDDEQPLEKARMCMSNHCNTSARFSVYRGDDHSIEESTDEDLFMANVIREAIENDRIVPYFQPIRDNRTQKIQKYEALMRLSDEDDNIYTPAQFMDIAKDYHVYLQMSQIMIRKALELFKDRPESIFLNLSAYDVSSEENREFLLNLLHEVPEEERHRVTFELLESENLVGVEGALDFIQSLRDLGVHIAVDDFGAGYSNMSEIIRVNPDYIKIDGDLVIGCNENPAKQICLQAISDMAQGLDAEIIAEHVENTDEQQTVESVNIDYTQGYYFSKPVPYNELSAVEPCAENMNEE